jgi:undecaprenyl-diphosphatase
MAIPALIGSALLTLPEIIDMGSRDGSTFTLLVAFLSAFVVGLIALKTLLGILRSGKLYLFSGYCFFMSVVALTVRF